MKEVIKAKSLEKFYKRHITKVDTRYKYLMPTSNYFFNINSTIIINNAGCIESCMRLIIRFLLKLISCWNEKVIPIIYSGVATTFCKICTSFCKNPPKIN